MYCFWLSVKVLQDLRNALSVMLDDCERLANRFSAK